jgi:hypothetical protein
LLFTWAVEGCVAPARFSISPAISERGGDEIEAPKQILHPGVRLAGECDMLDCFDQPVADYTGDHRGQNQRNHKLFEVRGILQESAPPTAPEINDYGEHRPGVEHHEKQGGLRCGRVHAHQSFGDDHVSRALYDRQKDYMQKPHLVTPREWRISASLRLPRHRQTIAQLRPTTAKNFWSAAARPPLLTNQPRHQTTLPRLGVRPATHPPLAVIQSAAKDLSSLSSPRARPKLHAFAANSSILVIANASRPFG